MVGFFKILVRNGKPGSMREELFYSVANLHIIDIIDTVISFKKIKVVLIFNCFPMNVFVLTM